jgi:4-hydroxybenzoate polyprenyltransferase
MEKRKADARRILAWATGSLLVGIALAATGNTTFGGIVTTAALVGTAYSLHRLGRSGPDAA